MNGAFIISNSSDLQHHGILGMKWGVRRFQNYDGTLTAAGRDRYNHQTEFSKESLRTIKVNSDGSKTVPKGFIFNRVGQDQLDVNASGVLYVSHGKDDAARYVKNLGPTLMGNLLGTSATTVQHITTNSPLKVPSDASVAEKTIELLLKNDRVFKEFNNSIYSMVVSDIDISRSVVKNALKNPTGKDAQKLAYAFSTMLGDPNYADSAKTYYDFFRKSGYDAVPDLHDILSGTATNSMIIINTKKIQLTSSTAISKDVMKTAKKYVKSLEKLKTSDLIKT